MPFKTKLLSQSKWLINLKNNYNQTNKKTIKNMVTSLFDLSPFIVKNYRPNIHNWNMKLFFTQIQNKKKKECFTNVSQIYIKESKSLIHGKIEDRKNTALENQQWKSSK